MRGLCTIIDTIANSDALSIVKAGGISFEHDSSAHHVRFGRHASIADLYCHRSQTAFPAS
jgi:hypothetical protein